MTPFRFIAVIFVSGLLATPLACAEDPPAETGENNKVYRKFHPDGVVEFSDQPLTGSEELKVEELPTYKFATPAPERSTPQKPETAPDTVAASPYTSLSITQPARNEAIRANDGNIEVRFTLAPELKHHLGHKIEYILDGKPILRSDRQVTLKNIDRGTHTLVVQIIDNNNKVLIHSDSVTFHVKRFFKPRS